MMMDALIQFFSVSFLTVLLSSGVRATTPLLLAGTGEMYAERAGILNLGIEGMMAMGAFIGFYVALNAENAWWGLAAGVATGVLLGLVTGLLAITYRANQIVLGLGITVSGLGLSAFLHRHFYGSHFPTLVTSVPPLPIPGLARIPVLGPGLFSQSVLAYLAVLIVVFSIFVIRRTRFGLNIRAAGENPFAADAAGVNIFRVRYQALVIAGAMAGLGGAFLSIVDLNFFLPGMIAGRGFLGIAICMLGRWEPPRILVGAFFFGITQALTNGLQVIGIQVVPEFLLMIPYVGVMVALSVLARHAVAPSALSLPYERGER